MNICNSPTAEIMLRHKQNASSYNKSYKCVSNGLKRDLTPTEMSTYEIVALPVYKYMDILVIDHEYPVHC